MSAVLGLSKNKQNEKRMSDENLLNNQLFEGLKALAESAFPKQCKTCGRVFETAEQFLLEARGLNAAGPILKESQDDDGGSILEVYGNCVCGSTLMSFFNDRRDVSEAGLRRRERFGELLEFLEAQGIERNTARMELLKVLRGEQSELLAGIKSLKVG